MQVLLAEVEYEELLLRDYVLGIGYRWVPPSHRSGRAGGAPARTAPATGGEFEVATGVQRVHRLAEHESAQLVHLERVSVPHLDELARETGLEQQIAHALHAVAVHPT